MKIKGKANLNDLMSRFRIASRNIRNQYFHPIDFGYGYKNCSRDGWDFLERFENIEESLFENMVLWRLGLSLDRTGLVYRSHPLPFNLYLEINAPDARIHRSPNTRDGSFDNIEGRINSSCTVEFVHYFDFDSFAFADNKYVMCYIIDGGDFPHISKHYALVENEYVKFTYAKNKTILI